MKENESFFNNETNKKFDKILKEMENLDFDMDMDFNLFKDDDIKE